MSCWSPKWSTAPFPTLIESDPSLARFTPSLFDLKMGRTLTDVNASSSTRPPAVSWKASRDRCGDQPPCTPPSPQHAPLGDLPRSVTALQARGQSLCAGRMRSRRPPSSASASRFRAWLPLDPWTYLRTSCLPRDRSQRASLHASRVTNGGGRAHPSLTAAPHTHPHCASH